MEIDLFLWAKRINNYKEGTAVVIDVLRASSTIITSLSNGAKEIIPVESIVAAQQKSESINNSLVAGERDGVKVDGFDLGNSPLDYQRERIKDKKIILTTTNGTKCFKRLTQSEEVIVASLLNLSAVINYLKSKEKVFLCCAGNYNNFAIDDFITAGKIIAKLQLETKVELTDKGKTAYQLYQAKKNNLLDVLLNSESGNNLKKLGNKKDIDYIVKGDQLDIIPIYKQGRIINSKVRKK